MPFSPASNECHLRGALSSYFQYYHRTRTPLDKDGADTRSATPTIDNPHLFCSFNFLTLRDPVHQALLQGASNEKRPAFTAAFASDDLDASVRLIEADDPRFASTVKAMEREFLREKHVVRYAAADDFGLPTTAFLICRFWLVDAWSSRGGS
jgi:hypothetical protein